MFKRKGGGSKAFWTMFKKTALFWNDGFPKSVRGWFPCWLRMMMKSSVVATSQRVTRQLFGWIFEVNALLQISIFIRTSTDCILSGWALWWRKRQSREWRWHGLGWQRWWRRSRLWWQQWWMMMTMMAGTSSNSELRQICKSFFRLIALQDKSHGWSSWWW